MGLPVSIALASSAPAAYHRRVVLSTLAPGFLVASPTLDSPFFRRTVVLLVEHDGEGTFGFVINKESPIAFEDVVGELALDAEPGTTLPLVQGGPVNPETGWMIFDPESGGPTPSDSIVIAPGLALTASRELLESVAAGDGPTRSMLALGYAGWGAGQLESEMKEGSWVPVDLDPSLVFDAPMEDRWELALRTQGIDPLRVIMRRVAQA